MTEVLLYNIPSSTVRHHKLNPSLKIGGGRPTILTKDQEQYLVELLKNLEINGFRLTKSVVTKLASEYVELVTGKMFIFYQILSYQRNKYLN